MSFSVLEYIQIYVIMNHKIRFDYVYTTQCLDFPLIYPIHILGLQDDFKSIFSIAF